MKKNEEIKFVWIVDEDETRLFKFLCDVDSIFIPNLSARVNIREYAIKLRENAENIFACRDEEDVGACSIYCNFETAFISSFAIKPAFMRMKIGSTMMRQAICRAKELECKKVRLEVYQDNLVALEFYEKCGFSKIKQNEDWITMEYKF